MKFELLDYMKQDIFLLGGVMSKAQDIYYRLYQLDVCTKITFSSLTLTIFRKHFYDEESTPIAIPHRTADEFIRRGYYGGHAASRLMVLIFIIMMSTLYIHLL